MSFKNASHWIVLFAASLFVCGFLLYAIKQPFVNISVVASAALIQPAISQQAVVVPVAPLNIGATSALSLESNLVDSPKILFAKNEDEQVPIASLSKLMTAMVVLDHYNLSDMVTVDQTAASQDIVTANDLKAGDTESVQNMLYIMIIDSSNRAAYALSEKMGEQAFVGLMNQKAQQIGLTDTSFFEPTGLSEKNVSTADDLSKLALYILKNYPEIMEITQTKDMNLPGFGELTNTDDLLGQVPDVVISKTGFTDNAKGCLLLATYNQSAGDYRINIILGSDDRFNEMENMIDWVNATYQ